MANALRLGPGDAVENVISYCREKVSEWTRGTSITSIDELEKIVCKRLRLRFEEFENESGLNEIVSRYVNLGETIFATLPGLFDETTFATLIERRKIDGRSPHRYVAVIDCRGDKRLRRFFTRWHEIAHLLTLYDQLELPLHRSTNEKTPTERLMDVIAGQVGFFDEILMPLLEAEIMRSGRLTFDGVERVRDRFAPGASFQSTLNACVARMQAPAAIIEVGWGFRKSEQRNMASAQLALIPMPQPTAKVRVLSFLPNEHSRGCIEVHRNMEVPADSVLFQTLVDPSRLDDQDSVEELGEWKHSDGKHLPSTRVVIQAQRVRDKVIGLLQLA
jgi:hypothetical protein